MTMELPRIMALNDKTLGGNLTYRQCSIGVYFESMRCRVGDLDLVGFDEVIMLVVLVTTCSKTWH